ncbi:site-specific integrase [Segetibacter aerophilus]|uniref:Integrase n=1 Tax=Segetibacter aerophilus TaxID=670293 RepID=A0A512BHC7_9BACT|nr:site-specific integrase [Segetibacter aerophilus]GEO11372.1 integrase [Segetibacter aerophilus]
MNFPIKPVCNSRFIRKDGTCLIYIQYCFSHESRTLLNTAIAIPPEYWNQKKECVSDKLPEVFGAAEEINFELKRMMRAVEDIIDYGIKKKVPEIGKFVKKTFTPDFKISITQKVDLDKQGAANINIYDQIDEYSKSKEKKVCKDMPRIYRNMKEHLRAFEEFRNKPITFDSLDLNFYEDFVDFLMFEYVQRRRKGNLVGLKVNTIGKTIKQFRTFLRNRMRKKIIAPIDMDGWTILEEEVDAVYLSMDEVHSVYNVDLSNSPHLISYRNDFVLGCLTGLRFSDFSELMKDDVRKDMLYKKQNKSEHWVVIPLRDEALQILKNRFDNKVSVLTNGDFNKHIKTIARMAGIVELIKFSHKKHGKDVVETKPKYEWITSHTCRRSFCTNEFLAGTPVELIMKISGHKSVKDFYKYIRITPEEAGQKMKELWKGRGGMKAFSKENETLS